MQPIIEVKDVYHQYGDTEALCGVSLGIYPGEFLAIVGANGSGKSTLARHLNGLLLPSSGEVKVKGFSTQDADDVWQIRSIVGMVFQNPDNQLVATTVEEDVAFGPENLGVPSKEIRKRVDEALKWVNMYEHRQRSPHQLSGGQKQRVAIAGILAMHPEVLVLDEPTAMLDPVGRQEVLEAITYLNKELKMAVVLITHHMDEVVLADRVVAMEKGKIAQISTPRELFSQSELVERLGLDVPQVFALSNLLQDYGIKIDVAFNPIELVNALCKLS
ncbi:MAG TPA: energy-coupling factor transporter ATPase [Firmicutes bacterium]|jgi:energy-coupling factor transport system ATP-binding protein|nr:energy-coupling factor transporter ATPase [Bacillota bacterium]